jgi:GT2 family glycosyltransferase
MAAPLINVKKYKQLGGFDLAFKGYFADIDLCHRAKQEGFKMYCDDTIQVNHLGGYTVQKEAKHEQASMDDNSILINKYGFNLPDNITPQQLSKYKSETLILQKG